MVCLGFGEDFVRLFGFRFFAGGFGTFLLRLLFYRFSWDFELEVGFQALPRVWGRAYSLLLS